MKPKKVNEIMKKLVKGWKNKIPKGTKLSYDFLKGIRDFLKLCPDEDGKKRVFDIRERYGKNYSDLCSLRKLTIDDLFILQDLGFKKR